MDDEYVVDERDEQYYPCFGKGNYIYCGVEWSCVVTANCTRCWDELRILKHDKQVFGVGEEDD